MDAAPSAFQKLAGPPFFGSPRFSSLSREKQLIFPGTFAIIKTLSPEGKSADNRGGNQGEE